MNVIRKIRRKEKQKDMLGVLTNSFENESRVCFAFGRVDGFA